MRSIVTVCVVVLLIGCGDRAGKGGPDAGSDGTPPEPCEGLRCQVTDCAKQGRPATTLSGTVFAPNGTMPLHGINVYVPNRDPGPLTEGAQCTRCVSQLPGEPIALAVTDEEGKFTLPHVPDGGDIPLVITVGKWRRQITIPAVAACTDNPLPAAQTSLPRNKAEGDLPKIAMVTGAWDALECLVRKLGVDDAEFTNDGGDGRVHLFVANGSNRTMAGQMFAPASSLWGDLDKMKQYDLAMFSCEGEQRAAEKSLAMMNAVKAYGDFGGRLFLSHYHHIWIAGAYGNPTHAPPAWPTVATCDLDLEPLGVGKIDEVNNPRGTAFARWMANVGGSATYGELPIMDARQTCRTIDPEKAERWVYLQSGASEILQNFQFTTPIEVGAAERCGKVVLSDMHVSSGSLSRPELPFPMGCSAAPMTPQEKALAFMFFDIASCVGPIF
ncbi:MAG TPA: hypothetical protein VK932_27780 [Kofleriaceae bacterium]|nr:hypothetical protein [Kofleriaceae bacterium]